MTEVTELRVKDFWQKIHNYDAVTGHSCDEVQQKTLRDAWKKLCPFFFEETETTPENCVSVSLLTGENKKELNLAMDAGDVVEFLNPHVPELTIDGLIEEAKFC